MSVELKSGLLHTTKMAESNMKTNSKLHIAMFPWLAFGHILPFVHLSNKLAQRGNKISLLLPKGVALKLAKLNKFPDLIRNFPLAIPHVDGLPLGAETLSDVPSSLDSHICKAMDQTRDQVRAILSTTKPDLVFYDLAYWIPALGRELGFKTVMYQVYIAALTAMSSLQPSMTIAGLTMEDIMRKESFYDPNAEFGCGISLADRMKTAIDECDALAIRTCHEMEAHFVDPIVKQFTQPVLLAGPVLPEKAEGPLEEKWENWLNKFQPGSVVFCAFGSQTVLTKSQFQEMVLGFELSGLPFLLALSRPKDCRSMEEALPDGFEERVKERGMVYEGWVAQELILNHPSVGCFVCHGGSSSMWESLVSSCQIVLVPPRFDHAVHAMLLSEELRAGILVKKEETGWFSKESLSSAIISAMSKDSDVAKTMKANHDKWRRFLLDRDTQETYTDNFVKNLHDLV